MAPIIVGDWQTLALQIIGYKANQGLEQGGTWAAALSMHTTSRARMVLVGGQPKIIPFLK